MNIPVYDADSRARWLQENDPFLIDSIKMIFGKEIYTSKGKLDRKLLASKVFGNKALLDSLNQLVHPKVFEDFNVWSHIHKSFPYIMKEAALMFESDSYKYLDKVILIVSPIELRIKRILNRDPHRSREEIHAIISKQLSDEEKILKADYLIHNDEKALLIPQVLELDNIFRK